MEVTIKIKNLKGEEVEVTQSLPEVGKMQSIDEIETFVLSIREKMLSGVEKAIIEQQQSEFDGEKNKEA